MTFQIGQRELQRLQSLLKEGAFAKQNCRSQALLWLAAGESPQRIADLLGVSCRTVDYWAERFQQRQGLDVAERRSGCCPRQLRS